MEMLSVVFNEGELQKCARFHTTRLSYKRINVCMLTCITAPLKNIYPNNKNKSFFLNETVSLFQETVCELAMRSYERIVEY